MSDVEQVGTNTPDGTVLGYLSTDKIAFYGATPSLKILVGATATTAPTSTSPCGFTAAQAQAILNAVLAIETLGLIGTV